MTGHFSINQSQFLFPVFALISVNDIYIVNPLTTLHLFGLPSIILISL